MRSVSIVVGIVLLVLVLLLAGSAGMMALGRFGMGQGMMGGYGTYPGMMNGYEFSPVGGILSAILWGLVICGVALFAAWIARNNEHFRLHAGPGELPLSILKARYAKGEITKEQFDSVKRDLGET
jgi:putative membrane protein